ncbi:uncharacterized protein [Argopecten irradians]|uniref:uncharacterized protein n=1 Tax=Argopecten irradians TaxID=31199 RepID=UPI00371835E2
MADGIEDVSSCNSETCLAECPVCLQQLRDPKSLPCFHSFCEDCLKTSILNQKQDPKEEPCFLCPACRVVTLPIDPKQNRDEWAMMFEADKLTSQLMSDGGNEKKMYYCTPCTQNGKDDTVATVWWKEANRYLCDVCKKSDFLLKNDTLLPIEANLSASAPCCDKHSFEVDMICEHHHSFCCSKCIAVDHRRCEAVHDYAEFVNVLRSSSKPEDVRKKLIDAIGAFTTIIKDLESHIQALLENKEGFLGDVKDLRDKIEEQLNQLQNALSEEVGDVLTDKKTKLECLIGHCQMMQRCMSTTKGLIEEGSIQKNDMHMIRVFQRGTMEIKAGRSLVKEIAEPYLTWRFTHEFEEAEQDKDNKCGDENVAENNLLASLSLGCLKTTSHEREFPVEVSVLLPLSLSTIREVNEFEAKTPSDNKDCQIAGLVYLVDGRWLVSDYSNEKLKMFSSDGDLLDELEVSFCRGICMKNEDTVAVARVSELISHVKIKSPRKLELQEQEDINKAYNCNQFTVDEDGCYLVGGHEEISRVTPDSRKIIVYTNYSVQGLKYDAETKSMVFTSSYDDSVKRVVKDGYPVPLTEPNEILSEPTGLDLDEDGNVYVCCNKSDKIVQISRHGILRPLADMSDPHRISICGRKIAVGMKEGGTVKFFEIM